ncbi:Rne/Rng family ribonuclease [Brevibacillus reuszeri]|uniref:Ribonuclease G n=1 Tax=Brevibacillus reuszeri TaxID=54915 RepID=A0A0K9YZ72_9BACL|nr:Rne/Rng family ribonuclease [Brevibacillus reuszeri]KNB73907.1 ribonuclease G [Brevibacillus reuszeri]MED1859944.1 Rne/Rng family ribonuclease [Brevibacillus reuszeri]
MRQIAISGTGGRVRAALLEKGRLREWRTEHESSEVMAGEIFLGRVADVKPGIQSAFVDIGTDKNAYLYVDDTLPRDGAGAQTSKQAINERIHVGEKILVQVSKEGSELKAPKLTMRISVQGRFLVFLPKEEGISISRKISDREKRQNLEQTLVPLLEKGEGIIIRTEAAEADARQLIDELDYLRESWQETQQQAAGMKGPGRVSRTGAWLESVLREFLSRGVDEVIVEHAAIHQQVKAFMTVFASDRLQVLRWYQGKQPIFEQLGVEAAVERTLQRQVFLKSGGHLVIDRTEAMTVIDVNTGSFTGGGGQQREQAVTATNLEAAEEIAHQLRLRDIGGIILIDFIDMKEQANKEKLLSVFKRELTRDDVPTTVLGMTALGLVEMTRKRVRPSLSERMTEPCVACGGHGRVWSTDEIYHRLQNEIAALKSRQDAEAVLVQLPTRLYHSLTERKEHEGCEWIESVYKLHDPWLRPDEYRIVYVGNDTEAKRLYER